MRITSCEYRVLLKKPERKKTKASSHANRGKVLEEIINLTNISYRRQRRAIINKVPTEWIPLRGEKGTIISAKVENKSTVDYVGRYGLTPIAFDAKESHEPRMRWDRVEEHQEKFLDDWTRDGHGIGFILASFGEKETYVIYWGEWKSRLERWREGGLASFKPSEIPGSWRVEKYDYLKTVDSMHIYFRFAK